MRQSFQRLQSTAGGGSGSGFDSQVGILAHPLRRGLRCQISERVHDDPHDLEAPSKHIRDFCASHVLRARPLQSSRPCARGPGTISCCTACRVLLQVQVQLQAVTDGARQL